MKARFILLFLLSGIGLSAQYIEDQPHLLDSLLIVHKDMHFYRSPSLGNADSVWHRRDGIYLYFDTDSICRQFVRKGGLSAVANEMNYLYFDIFTEMNTEQRAVEIQKMEKVANATGSEALKREVELQQAANINSDLQFEDRISRIRALLRKAEQRRDTLMQIRIRGDIVTEFWYHDLPFEAFEEATYIIKMLDNVTDEQYPFLNNLCFLIGEMYFFYDYNEQAMSLFNRVLKDATYFFDRSNLRARLALGIYYNGEGYLDRSDRYFRSMLESRDEVTFRGEYDAIAIANLGKNSLLRKDYNKAERLLRKAFPVMTVFDEIFTTGMYINLGNCYLETGKLPQTKAMIDSALLLIHRLQPQADYRYAELYPLMSKYYAMTGDAQKSAEYTDATIEQYNIEQKKYSSSHVFDAEKKVYEIEKQAKEMQLANEKMEKEKYRNMLILCLLIIIIAVGFYVIYSRLRRQKNRLLYKRILEEERMQAELSKIRKADSILQRLDELMQAEQLFTDTGLSRKMLADRLYTNENYLANAIRNGYNGQTCSEYINNLRLAHARNLLHQNPELSIKHISFESGFSSYQYFHKLFREEVGMSPSDYRAVSKSTHST